MPGTHAWHVAPGWAGMHATPTPPYLLSVSLLLCLRQEDGHLILLQGTKRQAGSIK